MEIEKSIVFDSGPIISLATNNLLWILEPLKKAFGGEFYITPAVYREVIEKPLTTKKYKFEALQVYPIIKNNILRIKEEKEAKLHAEELLELANTLFNVSGNWMRILHFAEVEVIATALAVDATTVVIDERTTRHLIEAPERIPKHLERELELPVQIHERNLEKIKQQLAGLKVLRSVELAVIAFEQGLFERYIVPGEEKNIPNVQQELLKGVLWSLKLNGCSIRETEIEEILALESYKRNGK